MPTTSPETQPPRGNGSTTNEDGGDLGKLFAAEQLAVMNVAAKGAVETFLRGFKGTFGALMAAFGEANLLEILNLMPAREVGQMISSGKRGRPPGQRVKRVAKVAVSVDPKQDDGEIGKVIAALGKGKNPLSTAAIAASTKLHPKKVLRVLNGLFEAKRVARQGNKRSTTWSVTSN
jgi:hypothetical protein